MSNDFCSGERRHTAHKKHTCRYCGLRIEIGEQYVMWVGKWCGDFGVMKLHERCEKKTRTWNNDDWENHFEGDGPY